MNIFSRLNQTNENSLYMVLEKFVLLGANFLVFAFMARLLGPVKFGTFSLVQAVLLVGLPVGLFASERVLVKLMLDDRYNNSALVKHVLIVKAVVSILVYSISVMLSYWLFGSEITVLVAILSLTHFFNYDVLFFANERARQESKKVFKIRLLALLPMVMVKLVIVYFYQNLALLFAVFVVEAVVLAVCAFIGTNRIVDIKNSQADWFDHRYMKELVRSCWPIFSAALLVMFYSRVDQFMIKSMLGDEQLGFYAAGAKLSEASTVLLVTFIVSRFPLLLALRKKDLLEYNKKIVLYLQLSLVVGFGVFICAFLFGDLILLAAFGRQYLDAASVMSIHMFGAIFIYFGVLCTQWSIAEELEIFRLIRVAVGMLVNIGLNIFWIPRYGIEGAAMATVLSQFGSNVLFNYVSIKTRTFFELEVEALNPKRIIFLMKGRFKGT